ncbi:MAG: acyl-phosphate glycerol 3-phosphate acyltransferase [Magnetovibrio sp.]|jgi:glycerol-3-phosphate acyltransferase PlsY|nr:acyl-phosphate glycerol 3-phosphate acyltransferase [Magnetovibrio sp.]
MPAVPTVDVWFYLVAAATGYLLGSIPFGLVLTRLAGGTDPRRIGSGNIGATNVLRTGSRPLAAATLVLDAGKGAAAALLLALVDDTSGLIAGFLAVVGHNFPLWLKFKGGKGVATTLGLLLAVAWPAGLLSCATWLAVAALFRYSSLAALVALVLSPLFMSWVAGGPPVYMAAALAVLAVIRHHANIQRLIGGEEPKIGAEKAE